LRVLEYRTIQKVGDTCSIRFAGKIIAATNRDLAAEMHAGRFRQDLYYTRSSVSRQAATDDPGDRLLCGS
jgi:transcriptional regulator with GAF, ATPase, and Fis domain